MRVPHDTHSAALVRRALREDMQRHQLAPECVDEVVLVASELVSNAVRHTAATDGAGLEVDWSVDAQGVTIRVSDPSPARPAPRAPSATDPGGRGLHIVEMLADGWGVERRRAGKLVWAHVPGGGFRRAGCA